MALNGRKKELRNPTNRDGKHLMGRADNKALFSPGGLPVRGNELVEAPPRLQSDSGTLALRPSISCQAAAAHLEGSGHACATRRAAARARTHALGGHWARSIKGIHRPLSIATAALSQVTKLIKLAAAALLVYAPGKCVKA